MTIIITVIVVVLILLPSPPEFKYRTRRMIRSQAQGPRFKVCCFVRAAVLPSKDHLQEMAASDI